MVVGRPVTRAVAAREAALVAWTALPDLAASRVPAPGAHPPCSGGYPATLRQKRSSKQELSKMVDGGTVVENTSETGELSPPNRTGTTTRMNTRWFPAHPDSAFHWTSSTGRHGTRCPEPVGSEPKPPTRPSGPPTTIHRRSDATTAARARTQRDDSPWPARCGRLVPSCGQGRIPPGGRGVMRVPASGWRWTLSTSPGRLVDMTATGVRLVARRHVDFRRVSSAMCRRMG
jgi:hypothetical protein